MKEIWNDPELRAELKLLRYHLTAPIFFAMPWPAAILDLALLFAILSWILWMTITHDSTLSSVLTAYPELKWIAILATIKSFSRSMMMRIIPASAVSKKEGGEA